LLFGFYGARRSRFRVPAPNMEWWWHTIEVGGGEVPELSLLTNVHLFAVPLLGWVTQATVALRDLASNRTLEAHTSGSVSADDAARFTATDFHLGFEGPSTYRVDVQARDFRVDLRLHHGSVAVLGEAPWPPGWYDLNPAGSIPIWASYRSRSATSIEGVVEAFGKRCPIREGTARMDHQSLHFSPGADVKSLSPLVLAEAPLLCPQWLWYHARLRGAAQRALNVMVCEVRNGHTGRRMMRAAAVSDDDGNVARVDKRTIFFLPRGRAQLPGAVVAPAAMDVELTVAPEDCPASIPSGRYALSLEQSSGNDWTVTYPIVGPLCYRAQEVPVQVRGNVTSPDGRRALSGTGTQEVLDMLRSVTVRR